MQRPAPIVALFVLCALVGLSPIAAAQPVGAPTIQRVTVAPDSGVLTITGTGLGPDLVVSVDGQPVTVLPGASDTQVEVMAPATVLTLPGTYRLTVLDPVRRVGDVFVVATHAGAGTGSTGGPPVPPMVPWRDQGPRATAPVVPAAQRPAPGGASPLVVESVCVTALGVGALANNTSGCGNTASGYQALLANSTGVGNTASGYKALFSNTTGHYNTGTGDFSLYLNTTGVENTASGDSALYSNTTGSRNTASGTAALLNNATGVDNTASGHFALVTNTTGDRNTASGVNALQSNSTGYDNTASGYQALRLNTTGYWNTASGAQALYANSTGYQNTATGFNALGSNTTGYYNTASGFAALYLNASGRANAAYGIGALYSNTSGAENAALGHDAGYSATTGSYNVFLGSGVTGTAADTNTIRIGLPYSGGVGQNRTFIAGIHGTQLTGPAVQVFVDANGQLGTLTAPIVTGGISAPVNALQRRLDEQQTIDAAHQAEVAALQTENAELRARLARLETRIEALGAARRR